jgi:hypothetical protein
MTFEQIIPISDMMGFLVGEKANSPPGEHHEQKARKSHFDVSHH